MLRKGVLGHTPEALTRVGCAGIMLLEHKVSKLGCAALINRDDRHSIHGDDRASMRLRGCGGERKGGV